MSAPALQGDRAESFGRHADPAVALLLDRQAVRDLVQRYAVGVDRRDFDCVASCFAPDVHGEFGGQERSNRGDLVEFIRGVSHFHTTMHFMGSCFVSVECEAAWADTLAMITHRAQTRSGRDFVLDMSDTRYAERLERRADPRFAGGAWVIAERGVTPRFAPTGTQSAKSDDPAVRWLLDRAEIGDLALHFGLALDRRDVEGLEACVAPGFRLCAGNDALAEREALGSWARHLASFESTSHVPGTGLVAIDPEGEEARASWRVLRTCREAPEGGEAEDPQTPRWMRDRGAESTEPLVFQDRLVRVAGRWRIQERRVEDPAEPPSPPDPDEAPRSADPAVQWLLDRAAIRDRVAALAGALDARDARSIAGCFTKDAAIEMEASGEPFAAEHHLTGNDLVEIEGDGARAETYVFRTSLARDGAWTHWGRGARRFVDDLIREGGGFRIARHRVEGNLVGATPESSTAQGGLQ